MSLVDCEGCARRRAEMAIIVAAGREWIKNPAGTRLDEIIRRMRDEAIAKGELK
jgi:hypothetical protein